MRFFYIFNIILLLALSCSSHRNFLEDSPGKSGNPGKMESEGTAHGETSQSEEHKKNISENEKKNGAVKGQVLIDSKKSTVTAQKAFPGVGQFKFSMSGYKGELVLSEKEGVVSGTLKFHNWGNGVPQPLKAIKLNGNRIFFERSMETREELKRYGGRTFFKQKFYGIFSPDFSKIKGYYRYLGAQDNWNANK